MDDAQEKEKAHRQGGASRTYSWPKKKRSRSPERGSDSHVRGRLLGIHV
jgi:hypothetical protein